jgi:hypothetical protein
MKEGGRYLPGNASRYGKKRENLPGAAQLCQKKQGNRCQTGIFIIRWPPADAGTADRALPVFDPFRGLHA